MWKELLDLIRQVITLHQDTQRNSSEIKVLQQDVKELRQELKELREDIEGLTRALERLAFEIHRVESDEIKEAR